MGLFKKKSESKENYEVLKSAAEGLTKDIEDATPNKPKEEWVWIEGFKGTDKDMKCRDFQYEFGARYSIPKDEVLECKSGFHLCRDLKDVYSYYSIGGNNRYFKVQALVKKSDLDKYGTYEYVDRGMFAPDRRLNNKLVAAEIKFLEELTLDEIFEGTCARDWSEKYKKLAIGVGLGEANRYRKRDILTDLGYSSTFAGMIVNDADRFAIAEAAGSQSDLSMDMKVWLIFNAKI